MNSYNVIFLGILISIESFYLVEKLNKFVDSYFQNSLKHVMRSLVDNIVLQAIHIVSFDDFFAHMNSVGSTARSLGK